MSTMTQLLTGAKTLPPQGFAELMESLERILHKYHGARVEEAGEVYVTEEEAQISDVREFVKLPKWKRDKILEIQAESVQEFYQSGHPHIEWVEEYVEDDSQHHIAKLGGLWAGVEFEYDVEAEIRAIRDKSMQHLHEEIDDSYPAEHQK